MKLKPSMSKMTCRGYQAVLKIQTPWQLQQLCLVVYHMLAIQNHKFHLVHTQAYLQATGKNRKEDNQQQ